MDRILVATSDAILQNNLSEITEGLPCQVLACDTYRGAMAHLTSEPHIDLVITPDSIPWGDIEQSEVARLITEVKRLSQDTDPTLVYQALPEGRLRRYLLGEGNWWRPRPSKADPGGIILSQYCGANQIPVKIYGYNLGDSLYRLCTLISMGILSVKAVAQVTMSFIDDNYPGNFLEDALRHGPVWTSRGESALYLSGDLSLGIGDWKAWAWKEYLSQVTCQ